MRTKFVSEIIRIAKRIGIIDVEFYLKINLLLSNISSEYQRKPQLIHSFK